MASDFGAQLTVVHAAPCLPAGGEAAEAATRESHIRQALDEISRLPVERPGGTEVLVEGGDPPMIVRNVAERCHADLLVIGRGSAAGVFGRLRTNAYAIIRESPCPVVSV